MRIVKSILLLCFVYVMLAAIVTVVQVAALSFHNPHNTAWIRMRVRQAQAAGKELTIKQTWLPIASIPRVMQKAVVAAEDDGFYSHHGFDWDAMKKAYELNEEKERIKRGGSTITQQLAKNLYLSPTRSYIRKGREAVITWLMELLLSKNRILELYLNCIEFGPGVFGIEEGARYHFGVSARQLTPDQACRLAAIIPSPLRYRVTGNYVNRRAANLMQIVGGPSASPDTKPKN
ncbi:monofunctional biosynthetic peptidoglycan transglycosylase [candidate division KSB1 bacterium]|nr:MAG: monofunctional biosynthetic peptidoglycan transglycosylase [candidate division KSB1 bacterium]